MEVINFYTWLHLSPDYYLFRLLVKTVSQVLLDAG